MRALNRKMLRDVLGMRGMVIVIALMITCGAATYITFLSTLDSLRQTQQSYYQDFYFSNVFASLKRAPNSTASRIREIEGVNRVETRVQAAARLEVPGFDEVVTGMIVSLPNENEPLLNRLYLREGRLPLPFKENEIVLGDGFADAQHFGVGDQIPALINGKRKVLDIVGIGLSPEFIYQGEPGQISPDLMRFAIIWMRRSSIETTYDMEGAFNNVVLSVTRTARVNDIITQLDQILEPYGSLGAISRKDQNSHFFITEELRQLQQTATIIPTIFIAVAAFLLNVVVGRLIRTQRGQIAILKAFGYSNTEVGIHYMLMVSVIVLLGVAGGIVLGYYLGSQLSALYADYYRFPYLNFILNSRDVFAASLISAAAAYSGVFFSVRSAALLPPAAAMQPELPKLYSQSWIEKMGTSAMLDQPTKMILRQMGRQRMKVAFGVLGVGFAISLMIVGRMSNDSVKYLIEVDFRQAQPFDLAAAFGDGVSAHSVMELLRISGVQYAEGYRTVPVRMIAAHRRRLTAIEGLKRDMKLRQLLDTDGRVVSVPEDGLMLTKKLADVLHIGLGDSIMVEFLEGSRRRARIPVTGYINQYLGISGYMNIEALERYLSERGLVTGIYLQVDRSREEEVMQAVEESPFTGEIISKQKLIDRFYESTAQTWLIMALFVAVFAGAMAFSVVYNNARISLSERSRELASLRVLGLTRGEISYILLGELALIVVIAIPLGFLLGWGLTSFIVWSLQTELYRLPMATSRLTYAIAAAVIILSAVLSGWMVRRRIDRLDLIGVLKTRE